MVEQAKTKVIWQEDQIIGRIQGKVEMNRGKIETRLADLYRMLERVQMKLIDGNLSSIVYTKTEILENQILSRIERLEAMLEECEDEEE